MINREELIRSKEYWLEIIQNSLFLEIEKYIDDNDLNKTKFAEKLGVSKSYLTQVLNGNFDHKLSKLIELSLAIDKIPIIKFENILDLDEDNKVSENEKHETKVKFQKHFTTRSLNTNSISTKRVLEKNNK